MRDVCGKIGVHFVSMIRLRLVLQSVGVGARDGVANIAPAATFVLREILFFDASAARRRLGLRCFLFVRVLLIV